MKLMDAEKLIKVWCADCDNKSLCKDSPSCEDVKLLSAVPDIKLITPEDLTEAYKRGYLEGYKLGARLQTPINEWDVPKWEITCEDSSPITYT